MSLPKPIKKCLTDNPDLNTRLRIIDDLKSSKFIDNGETINIGIVYHVCYQNYNKTDIDLDITYVTNEMNKDFNKNPDNFNNGSSVYNFTTPTLKLYPYRKKYKLLKITRRIRGRRRLRYLRINRIYTRKNRRINRINRRLKILNRRRTINHRNTIKQYANLESIYTNYVNRAGNLNVNFQHIQTVYNPLPNITSQNLDTIDQIVKINGSPVITPDKYLNVWIVRFDNGLLGYAQFPWELSSKPSTDGVVISQYAFGRFPAYQDYNLNKTITHEVGHWAGLYHNFQTTFSGQQGIFDNNNDNLISTDEKTGDLISDTPIQNQPTYGNPYNNPLSWPYLQIKGKKYYSMFMNYMDYTDDINMFMFTAEQASKTRGMLGFYRPSLTIL